MLAHGEVGLDYIKKRMGHESIETSMDIYGQLMPGREQKAMRRNGTEFQTMSVVI